MISCIILSTHSDTIQLNVLLYIHVILYSIYFVFYKRVLFIRERVLFVREIKKSFYEKKNIIL